MFFILGISISVFLEFLLLIKRNKSRADKILAIWLLLICGTQLINYFFYTGEIFNYPHLLGIESPVPILNGIMLYFYVSEITGHKITGFFSIFIHFIPALSVFAVLTEFFGLSADEKVFIYQNEGAGYEWFLVYHEWLLTISGFAYSIASLLRIKKYRHTIQTKFSNTDKKELQWLQYLSIGLGGIWILAIFFDSNIIYSGVVIFVLFIGFFGINQLNIFNTMIPENGSLEDFPEKPIKTKTTEEPNRYSKSGLSKDSSEELFTKLNRLMLENALYKDNDLTLSDLADKLNVHSNHVSQVINERAEKNFYNYINSLRIQEFIRQAQLPENEKYTLLSLAFECGFNSKSTFNKHFKENTGKTPTLYFKELKA